MKNQVMIDTETLGLNPGCVVLSVGAVVFSFEESFAPVYKRCMIDGPNPEMFNGFDRTTFYMKINRDASLASGLTIESKVEKFWNDQPADMKAELFTGGLEPSLVFTQLREFIKNVPDLDGVWANSPQFDFSIIQEAMHRTVPGFSELPWHYRKSRDMRTLKNVLDDAGYVDSEMIDVMYPVPVHLGYGARGHNALVDAAVQAHHTWHMNKRLLSVIEDLRLEMGVV